MLIIAAPSFEDSAEAMFREVYIGRNHRFRSCRVKELSGEAAALIIMIIRGGETIIPNGETVVSEGDTLVTAKRDAADNQADAGTDKKSKL